MQTVFLTILGVIVFIAFAIILLIYFFKRKLNSFIEMAQKTAGSHLAPRIHLAGSAEPLAMQAAINYISQFDAMGYTSIGAYNVPELMTARIFAMHHPQHNLAVAVCEVTDKLAWFDISAIGVDVANTTFAGSSPVFNRANHPPTSRISVDPNYSPMAAQEWVLENRGAGPWRTLDAQHFAHEFERAYARSMDFQLARGAPDIEAVKLTLRQLNDTKPYSEADLAYAVEMQEAQFHDALTEACKDNFLQSSTLPAREWERIRDQVHVVHERLPLDDAAIMAAANIDDEDDDFDAEEFDFAAIGITTPQDAFMYVVKLKKLTRRLKYLGAVTEPVAAKLYYFDYTPH
jgi:hypothetical protein